MVNLGLARSIRLRHHIHHKFAARVHFEREHSKQLTQDEGLARAALSAYLRAERTEDKSDPWVSSHLNLVREHEELRAKDPKENGDKKRLTLLKRDLHTEKINSGLRIDNRLARLVENARLAVNSFPNLVDELAGSGETALTAELLTRNDLPMLVKKSETIARYVVENVDKLAGSEPEIKEAVQAAMTHSAIREMVLSDRHRYGTDFEYEARRREKEKGRLLRVWDRLMWEPNKKRYELEPARKVAHIIEREFYESLLRIGKLAWRVLSIASVGVLPLAVKLYKAKWNLNRPIEMLHKMVPPKKANWYASMHLPMSKKNKHSDKKTLKERIEERAEAANAKLSAESGKLNLFAMANSEQERLKALLKRPAPKKATP